MIHIYAMQIPNGDQHGTAELLLNRSLGQCTDVQTPVQYYRNKHGKPYLTDAPEVYVNWSHSGDYVICAISDQEVGIDLQRMDREPKENLIRKTLMSEECEDLKKVASEDQKKRFYEYWSVKESFLKALGTGFYISPNRFFVDFTTGQPVIKQQINDKHYVCRLLAFFKSDYMAAICVENGILRNGDLKITYL